MESLILVPLAACLLAIIICIPGWIYLKNRGLKLPVYEYGANVYNCCLWFALVYVGFGNRMTFGNLAEILVLIPIANVILVYLGIVIRRYDFGRKNHKAVGLAVIFLNLCFVILLRAFVPVGVA